MFTLELTIAGIATGCIYALAGIGLVLTYKATGIFNFAHGAIAMIVAYVFWQTDAEWHWPFLVAALFSLLVVGPGIGLLLERLVFRPLQRKGATTAEKLVATIGVFLLCIGFATFVWTGKLRTAPRLITNRGIKLPHHLILGVDQLVIVLITVAVGGGLAVLFRYTRLGIEIRAVVDRRELAELSSVNANRVAGVSWAMGCGLAGLTGVLLAPGVGLDPIHLTLLVIETFSIAVVAGLTSLPVAVGAGIVILGLFQSYFLPFEPHLIPILHSTVPNWVRTNLDLIKPNLSVLVLFIALVVLRRLDEPADSQPGRPGLMSRTIGATGERGKKSAGLLVVLALGVAILLPFWLNGINHVRGQVMLADIVVFASIVCITGFCGYITLGQAGFAGFGAYVTGRMVTSLHWPVIPAMFVGGLGALVLGIIAGYPALKRRGLFLGLTTLSVGLLMYEGVFNSDVFKTRGLKVPRPGIFGLSLSGDRAFYFFELFLVVALLLFAANLRKGRLGRILAAMRDSETAAQSVGIELRTYKLFIFAISAFIAGIGGAMMAEQTQVFSADQFHPINGLLWFTAVIVAGVTSIWGAVIGGAVFVLLDVVLHVAGSSQLIIAIAALLIGYLPGGSLVGLLGRIGNSISRPRGLQRAFAGAMADKRATAATPALIASGPVLNGPSANGRGRDEAPSISIDLVPTPFAERVLEQR